jgi:hypothetical protein
MLFRESSGTAALCGRDLPPDETLAAYANVNARAAEYQESGVFGDARLDQYRATAYCDLLNGVPAWERVTSGHLAGDDASGDGEEGRTSPDDNDGPTVAALPARPRATAAAPETADTTGQMTKPQVMNARTTQVTCLRLASRRHRGSLRVGHGPVRPAISRGRPIWSSRWPPSSARRNAPASLTGSACSTLPCAAA